MDVKYINPFITATLHVLETMAHVKAQPGKPYVKRDKIATGDVTGVMGLSLSAAIPTVIMGKNHSLSPITTYPVIAIPFKTDLGEFTIEVSFEE